MATSIAERYKKITIKTIPVFLAIVVLIAFSHPQVMWFVPGFIMVMSGEILRVWAVGHLMKTKEVTTTGPYAYVKNPLYLGTFLILVGFCLMASNFILLVLGLVVFVVYYAPFKKKRESQRLLNKFGSSWAEYDQAVPDYFPLWIPYAQRGHREWSRELFLENSENGTLLAVCLGTAILFFRFFI